MSGRIYLKEFFDKSVLIFMEEWTKMQVQPKMKKYTLYEILYGKSKLVQKEIYAGLRKVKAKWTKEMADDLQKWTWLDPEKEVEKHLKR